jgi:hypothetical protein
MLLNTFLFYQHYTNAIEIFFSILKSRLHKLNGLKYEELNKNIEKVIKEIPKEKYENIIKGTYKKPKIYIKKISNRVKELNNYL